MQYEVQVNTGFTTKFIDAYIPRTMVLIEQKGFTKDLTEKQVIEQALLCVVALPDTMPYENGVNYLQQIGELYVRPTTI